MVTKLDQLVPRAAAQGASRLIVAAAADLHTLESVCQAAKLGVVSPILVGDEPVIKSIAQEHNLCIEGFEIVHESSPTKAVEYAVRAINDGKADMLMKGLLATDIYMKGILNKNYGIVKGGSPVSHVAVMELPQLDRLLLVSDVAIIPYPDLKQKIALSTYLVNMAKVLGNETPRLALIAPSEQVLPSVTSSSEAAVITMMAARGQILSGAIVDGPLALDVALDEETVQIKKLSSPVGGKADCLLFPNIDSSNTFFKSATKLCKASLAGVVVGAKVPCILTSRGDSADSKLYSIALAALLSKMASA